MTDEEMRILIEKEIEKSPIMKKVYNEMVESLENFKKLETEEEKFLFLFGLINALTFVVTKLVLNANPVADLFDRIGRKDK